jgi:Skp family chaperone for outer membrane proteins
MRIRPAILAASFALACALPVAARAQSKDFFVPNRAQPAPPPTQAAAPVPEPQQEGAPPQLPPIPEPPLPALKPLPPASLPPTAVFGTIGVPEVMRGLKVSDQVDHVINGRLQALSDDAKKAQATWRSMQEALSRDAAKLSPAEIQKRRAELDAKVLADQKSFRTRQERIQEAAQIAFSQIQAVLKAVVQQVAQSHGMNIVLLRTQVAISARAFDISDEVQEEMNNVLPSVNIPGENEDPMAMAGKPAPVLPSALVTTPPDTAPALAPAAAPKKK